MVMNKIRGVVFDAYGTLFDVQSISTLADSLFPGQGTSIAALWRDKQIEYSRLVTISDPDALGSQHYASFWELTQAALLYSLSRLGLSHEPAHVAQLMAQYAHLDAFAECKSVLEQIRKTRLPMAVLSNGSPQMLQSAADNAGLSHLLDHLISVERVRQFKTHPLAYGLASTVLQIPSQELLFVSSNGWDVMGATWFGFTTCWVNRSHLPLETIGPRPSFVVSDLNEMLTIDGLLHQGIVDG